MVFPFCESCVTVYRRRGDAISRFVYSDCHLQRRCHGAKDSAGFYRKWDFLLIVPGDRMVLPGDRVTLGVGPEGVRWEDLQEALTVGYSAPYIMDGGICHWQAGGKM